MWTKQTSFSKSELPVNIGIHGAGFDTSDINLIFLYLHFKNTTVSDVVYVSPDGTFNINKYFTLERSMLGDNPTCHIEALVYQGPNHPEKVLATLDIHVTQ